MIQRYTISHFETEDEPTIRDDDGEWVRWEDLQAFLGQQLWEVLEVYQERDRLQAATPAQETADLHQKLEDAHIAYMRAICQSSTVKILQVYGKSAAQPDVHYVLSIDSISQTPDGVVIGVGLPP